MNKMPPDHSELNCRCCLETVEEHPPTTWGHMQPRTMADPCPVCGGTEYYCTHMVDLVLSNEENTFSAIMKAMSELYEAYYKPVDALSCALRSLLDACDKWLA